MVRSSFKRNEPKTRDLEKVRARGCFRKAQDFVNFNGGTALKRRVKKMTKKCDKGDVN